MVADGLTKPLSGELFQVFKDMMGMRTDITKRALSWWLSGSVGIRVRSGRKGRLLGTQECCLQMTHRATHFILYLAE